MEDKKKEDAISNPNHYKLDGLNIEARDVIKSVLGTVGFLGFYKGNIIKYILRANKKNGLEDYKKARQYLEWLIDELDEDTNVDGQLTYLDGELAPEEGIELNELSRKLLHSAHTMTKEEMERHAELTTKKYGPIEDARERYIQNRENFLKLQEEINRRVTKMKRELTPEEEQEMEYIDRKMLSSVLTITDEEAARYKELAVAKFGTVEEIKEEQRQNRKNFYKLQDKLSKKVTK